MDDDGEHIMAVYVEPDANGFESADGSDGYLYMYGPDADRLFEVVRPILENTSFIRGAVVRKRYGPPEDGVKEHVIKIAL